MRGFFAAEGIRVALLNFNKILDLCNELGPLQFYYHNPGWPSRTWNAVVRDMKRLMPTLSE